MTLEFISTAVLSCPEGTVLSFVICYKNFRDIKLVIKYDEVLTGILKKMCNLNLTGCILSWVIKLIKGVPYLESDYGFIYLKMFYIISSYSIISKMESQKLNVTKYHLAEPTSMLLIFQITMMAFDAWKLVRWYMGHDFEFTSVSLLQINRENYIRFANVNNAFTPILNTAIYSLMNKGIKRALSSCLLKTASALFTAEFRLRWIVQP